MDARRLILLPQFKPLLKPKRYKGAKGGRAGGRSHFFAQCVVKLCTNYNNFNIVCIREIQKSLKFSAKKLIEDKIESEGLSNKFIITRDEIRGINGSLIIFQGMQDHTAESIKSLEGFDVAWVEEAQTISWRSLELLIPTIRTLNSEIWFSWNPTFEDDAIEIFFNQLDESNSALIASNYDTNTLLPQTIIDEAERHRRTNPETFDHVWLGGYKTSNQGSIYKFNREINSTDKTLSDLDDLIIGQDFNVGGCCSVVYIRMGDSMYAVDEFVSKDTFEIRDNILARYPNNSIEIIPDASGKSGKTNATKSDLAILHEAGFNINAPKRNPRIEDRINVANNMYKECRLFINTEKCPNFTKSQIQHQYNDDGSPQKFSGAATIDDWNDAGTYPIHRLFHFDTLDIGMIKMKNSH